MPPSGKKVLVVGATSAIAQETSRLFAAYGAQLFLTGRNAEKLASVAQDLRLRGAAQVDTAVLDVADLTRHEAVIDAAFAALGEVEVVLLAHGVLPDQSRCEQSASDALETLTVNFTATVALLTPLANRLEAQRRGCLAVISSVAGDPGRQSNYVYGASKGGLDRFLEGLRNRLYRSGVAVLTIKPGFVDTPMTASKPKNSLYASPARVARGIHSAIEARRNVVYLPWFWRPIMCVVDNIPESLFKRLRL